MQVNRPLLERDWSLRDALAALSESDFPRELEAMQRARLQLDQKGKVGSNPGELSDRFFPDFLIRMTTGGIIAAEYKGDHLATGKGSEGKKRLDKLWERRSGGRCAFASVEKQDWSALNQAASRLSV